MTTNLRKLTALESPLIYLFLFFSVSLSAYAIDDTTLECEQYVNSNDREAAINHWETAAKAGDAKSQFCLGLAIMPPQVWMGQRDEAEVEENSKRSIELIQRSADQGFAPAQEHLAESYYFGKHGLRKS